ncbi:hypothetical protein [Stappia sediminis]|nr:hypothetical protein [Stappia sediminis]
MSLADRTEQDMFTVIKPSPWPLAFKATFLASIVVFILFIGFP